MNQKCSKESSGLSRTMAAFGLMLILWPDVGFSQRSSWRRTSEPAPSVDPNAIPTGNSWASFDIILKRNIFSRQRVSVRRQEVREAQREVTPNPEAYYLLKGVVQQNDDFIAFLEDTQGGTVLRLRRGDPVARGTIKTLTLDGLEYQSEDKTVVVRLGFDLEGGRGALTATRMPELPVASTPAATGQPAPTPPGTTPSGAEADILKRLMEQRKQQLGR